MAIDPSPAIQANGLISGLNTQQIINAELQPFLTPVNNAKREQALLATKITDYQTINSDLLALQTAARALASRTGWGAAKAVSSNTAAATATAAAGTPSGTVQFTVSQLAAADSLISAGAVAATSVVVASTPSFLLGQAAPLGFASLAAGAGLALGSHDLRVTQASASAATTGTVNLAAGGPVTISTGVNDTVNVTVDGTAYALTLAAGTYTTTGTGPGSLLDAVTAAATAAGAGGALQASYDTGGHLVLSSKTQGSTQTLQVTGGSALGALGLAAMGAADTGVDAVVTVDGTATTLSTVSAGATVSLAAGTGTISATIGSAGAGSSLLAAGDTSVSNVSTGNGSLADVVANINAAGAGVTASAISTSGGYVLQLSSTKTGSAADLTLDTSAFAGSQLGALHTATAGADAQIQVGGAGGYTLTSATDTFSGLLPGLDVTVTAPSSTPVTVTVSPDADAAAAAVSKLVDATNTVLADLTKFGGYDAATKTAGPLMGAALVQTLSGQVQSILASVTGTSTLGNARNVGIDLKDGQVSFDKDAFTKAFTANPAQVAAMFTRGGTFNPLAPGYAGTVSLTYAGDATKTGSYDVHVSQSALQATDAGAVLAGGTIGTGETLTVTRGGVTAQYTTTAGQSLTDVVAGLNAAFAAAKLNLSAVLGNSGQQVSLVTGDYGSAAAFTVTSTNTGAGSTGLAGTFTGTDVAGTINGVAATGTGQTLAAPIGDPTLAGLALTVTATGISTDTDLGSFHYTPGIAQALSSVAYATSDSVIGSVTQTIKGLQGRSHTLDTQVAFYQRLVDSQRELLTKRYADLEATLGTLKSQSTRLANALANLAKPSGG